MEPNRFFDIPIKLVLEHYEKQAQKVLTLETYTKGQDMRELPINSLGAKLMVQVLNACKWIEKMDTIWR